ncbi:MAG: hypothetical protein MO852_16685, partial [Candidatus Devosia euplotis]|nr:hypothetical protein [Candidatus Devosia euplotis]
SDPSPATETVVDPIDHTDDIDALRGTIADLQSELTALKMAQAGALTQQDLDDLEGRLGGDIGDAEGDTSALGTRVGDVEEEVGGLTGDLSTVDGKVDNLDGELAAVDQEVDGVSGSVAALDGKVQTEVEGLGAEIDGVEGAVAALDGKVQTEVAGLGSEIDGVESTVAGLSEDLTALEDAHPEVLRLEKDCTQAGWREVRRDFATGGHTRFRTTAWEAAFDAVSVANYQSIQAWVCNTEPVHDPFSCEDPEVTCTSSSEYRSDHEGCTAAQVRVVENELVVPCGYESRSRAYNDVGELTSESFSGSRLGTVILRAGTDR